MINTKRTHKITISASILVLAAMLNPAMLPLAMADDCLLDTNNDGNADTNVDTDLGADSSGVDARVACGDGALASGAFGTAIGAFSSATATFATALGNEASATGFEATALGARSEAGANNATAVGFRAQVTQSNSLVLGSIAGQNSATSDTAVGIGTTAPSTPLHVRRTNGTARILVEESNATPALRQMFELVNNGDPSFVLTDNSSGNQTEFRLFGSSDAFAINHIGSGGADFRLDRNGDLTIKGTLTEGSDRAAKTAITAINARDLLAKLEQLDITEWQFKSSPGVGHVGPMAQDFHRLFGYGNDETKISPRDMASVSLAAVKTQQKQLDHLQSENTTKNVAIGLLKQDLAISNRQIDALQQDLVEKNADIDELRRSIAEINVAMRELVATINSGNK